MRNLKQNLLIVLTLISFIVTGTGSTANSQQPPKQPDNFKPRTDMPIEQQQQNSIKQRERALRNVGATLKGKEIVFEKMPVKISPDEATRRKKEIENSGNIKSMLRPPSNYYVKYVELLKNKNMNLARLFVEKNCDQGKTVSVQELERCADVIPVMGGGSYYSFRLKDNGFFRGDWWDIHFTDNKFVVGNDTVQTIISEIGTVDLQTITLKSKALTFLKSYKPKHVLAEIKEQNKILKKGIDFNNFTYSNSASVKPNSTYVLRSVAYRLKEDQQVSNFGKGIDSFVAFKIIGREDDGSLILLWKELRTDLPRKEIE